MEYALLVISLICIVSIFRQDILKIPMFRFFLGTTLGITTVGSILIIINNLV